MSKDWCYLCGELILVERVELGYTTCMPCGERQARRVKHTIVPMHKSNYMVISNLEDLKGINNKGGLYR